MRSSHSKPSLSRTAATGILVDPDIRRAAAHAAPPVARLGFTIGRRMARQEARRQLEQAEETFSTLRSLLSTAGPQLAEQLGLLEPPRRRRRFLPVAGVVALAVAVAVVGSDPRQRQKIQRLIVH